MKEPVELFVAVAFGKKSTWNINDRLARHCMRTPCKLENLGDGHGVQPTFRAVRLWPIVPNRLGTLYLSSCAVRVRSLGWFTEDEINELRKEINR